MSNQLFIGKYDNVYLPSDFHLSHNIAVLLYDDLVWILKDKDTFKKFNVKVKLKDGEKKPYENEKDILSWLYENGYSKQANTIIVKNTISAVISDLCYFIFQALDSAKGIKMAVAYSLIRKPFLENLLIIEQLLVDEHNFLRKFAGKPEDFDPGKLKEDEKINLICECLSKLKNKFTLNEDIIYQLRFDKKNPNSFYAWSNLATHLVTTRHSEFKTESNNLNFVFSNDKEWKLQLYNFYYFVPYMLFYTTEIIDLLLLKNKIISIKTYKKRKLMRLFGQMIQVEQHNKKAIKGNSVFTKLSKLLKVKCKNCNKTNQLFKSDIYSLVHDNYILCKYCLVDLSKDGNFMDHVIEKFTT